MSSTNTVSLSRRITRFFRQKLLHSVTPDGYTSMDEFSPEDIFVVGYPKSGNTWFQALVAGAVYGVLPDVAPMSVIQTLAPDVHATPFYKRHAKTMFFKSHHLPDPRYRRVIYLLRDGRDAMVSYLHYVQAVEGRKYNFLDFVRNDPQIIPCKWHTHVQAWLANPFNAQMMIVRYEDLKSDPVRELKRMCAFAGIERSTELLELAARSATFDKMRHKEKTEGPFSPKWTEGEFFCRRGVVGSHREEMPGEVLDFFMQESAPALRQCGYN